MKEQETLVAEKATFHFNVLMMKFHWPTTNSMTKIWRIPQSLDIHDLCDKDWCYFDLEDIEAWLGYIIYVKENPSSIINVQVQC